MWRMIAATLTLSLVLGGCIWDKSMPEFGTMPPIVPEVAPQSVTGDQAAVLPDAPLTDEYGDADAAGRTVIEELDLLWAQGDWDSVIDLLGAESENPEAALDAATINEKLYAAYINAGHAALRLNNREAALGHFFAAMELAPERGEGDAGLSLIRRSYMDEARQLLETLQQDQAQQQQPQAQADPPADPQG